MNVLSDGHEEGMLACTDSWTSDRQDDMSRESDSSDYEYRRRMLECAARSIRRSCSFCKADKTRKAGAYGTTGQAGTVLFYAVQGQFPEIEKEKE